MLLTHLVSAQEDGWTLHRLLRDALGLSGRQLRLAKQSRAITVDGAPFFANQCVHAGMCVRVALSAYEGEASPCHGDVPLPDVLYEDDVLLAVRKRALLQCHPSPSAPGGSDTLEGRVQRYLGAAAHPVHRLDAETTGLVLFAKLPYAQAQLQRQMQAGTFQKTYQAWVFGTPQPDEGAIDAPIARETPDSFTRVVRADGQRAVSRYTTMRTLALRGGHAVSLVALTPVTGRTHQLRVHMAHIGCPLLGDTRYFTAASREVSSALGLGFHQLSAVRLSFLHPVSGEPVTLLCPPDFAFSPDSPR